MNNIWLVLVPGIVIVVLYVLIFYRKEERARVKQSYRNYDWFTFFACILGCILISTAMRQADLTFPVVPLLIITNVLIIGLVAYALIRRARTGKPVIHRMGDERTEMVMAKSARNAFFATYLMLFVNLCISDSLIPDATGMLILLGGGIAVLLVSAVMYYYQNS
ncbi:MAG: DUF2919 family protein [Dehalococcoidales bacterium]|nr:DUF2919 family protein [Dehalococcoidales bacterium]